MTQSILRTSSGLSRILLMVGELVTLKYNDEHSNAVYAAVVEIHSVDGTTVQHSHGETSIDDIHSITPYAITA